MKADTGFPAAESRSNVRTIVSTVLFLDVVGYSKRPVDEQVRLKQTFNAVLHGALEHVDRKECVVLDTGDGAALTFLGDAEHALFVALSIFDNAGTLELRMGINLGPVSLIKDVNGGENVVGDGINVAQRVMSFAEKGELLVSRSFYEVVALISGDYSAMFSSVGKRADKHARDHEIYAVSEAVRVGRRVAGVQSKLRSDRRPDREASKAGPAQVFDAGTHFMVSGPSRESVVEATDALARQGCKLISTIDQVGNKWMASVQNPHLAVAAKVEQFGMKHFVTAPTREAVEMKVSELVELGASLLHDIECFDGQWTAVCENAR